MGKSIEKALEQKFKCKFAKVVEEFEDLPLYTFRLSLLKKSKKKCITIVRCEHHCNENEESIAVKKTFEAIMAFCKDKDIVYSKRECYVGSGRYFHTLYFRKDHTKELARALELDAETSIDKGLTTRKKDHIVRSNEIELDTFHTSLSDTSVQSINSNENQSSSNAFFNKAKDKERKTPLPKREQTKKEGVGFTNSNVTPNY